MNWSHGDRVWSPIHGWGEVEAVNDSYVHSVTVVWESSSKTSHMRPNELWTDQQTWKAGIKR
jgi:hypothetical protein